MGSRGLVEGSMAVVEELVEGMVAGVDLVGYNTVVGMWVR